MPRWIKNAIMIGVFVAWGTYIGLTLANGGSIPLPLWAVPGSTYALLSNKVTGIRIGSGGVNWEEDDEPAKRRSRPKE